MENENEQLNNTPIVNTEELESSINELVEVIKLQEQTKEEQILLEQKESEKEQSLLEEEKTIEQQELLEKEKADSEFKEHVLKALNTETPSQIDYTEQLNAISEQLSDIKEYQNYVSESDHVINIYGLIIIPGCLIIFFLWKMIKAFI